MRLDARAPLVLDTHELGRRPGSERRVAVTAPAPADLGIEVVRVVEGAPIELDLRLEAVVEGVLVTGRAHAATSGECVRCLDDLGGQLAVDLQELFVYDDEAPGVDTEDEETHRMVGDLLDLEPTVRDAMVLALPLQPLCREDCPGLCSTCGARLADDPQHRHEEEIDPRWAALQAVTHGPSGARSTALPATGRSRGPTEE